MTSLRQLPRFAAGQKASHWPANKVIEDLSSCEQDSSSLHIIATKTATQAPNSLASASIVCNFVDQIRQVRERPTFGKRSSAPPCKILGQQTTALISSTCRQTKVVVSIWSTAVSQAPILGLASERERLTAPTISARPAGLSAPASGFRGQQMKAPTFFSMCKQTILIRQTTSQRPPMLGRTNVNLQHRNLHDPRSAKRPSLLSQQTKALFSANHERSASRTLSASRQQIKAPTFFSMCRQTILIRQTISQRPPMLGRPNAHSGLGKRA